MDKYTLFETLKKLTQSSSVIIFALTLIGFFGRYPFLELSTHFRLQYVWLSIICLIFLLFSNSWTLVILAFISILLNGIYILPYYLHLSVIILNLLPITFLISCTLCSLLVAKINIVLFMHII